MSEASALTGRVFVARQVPHRAIYRLQEAGLEVDLWTDADPPSPAQLRERARGCVGLLSLLSDQIDEEFFAAAGSELRVVSNFAVGYNNIDLAAAARRGVYVPHTPDVLTEATPDLTFALLIAAARRLKEGSARVHSGDWLRWEPCGLLGQSLRGKTLGIFGLGRIGAALARRCAHGWEMEILYCARSPKPMLEREIGGDVRHVTFPELLSASDFLSVHAPLTPETAKIFDRAAFRAMKQSAVFVNCARGGLHDEVALYEALQSGEIFAAGLDVTDPEPISPTSPLLGLSNCLVVPHIGSATIESREAMALLAAENIIAALAGEPLPAEVPHPQ